MEFRLLGPLEASEREEPRALGGAKQRALLAVLLLNANQAVSVDRLMDELWGDQPPATATKSIQVYVSRLRRQLGDGRLLTRPPGYLLQVDPSELDLARFEQLLTQASEEAPRDAAETLREALAFWRGPALADLAYERFAQPHIVRLEELRLTALESRIEADLASGRHAELVGELEALVAEHPLRERLRGHLMLALYRSGRQAEALQAYRAARLELSEELGLEPGEDLRRLERAILQQDPSLDFTAEAPRPGDAESEQAHGGSLLVYPSDVGDLAPLMSIAAPLAAAGPPRELMLATVVPASEIGPATRALSERREELLAGGLAARCAAFASPTPGEDVARLAAKEDVELLLMDVGSPLAREAGAVLERAPCDVVLLVEAGGALREGPIVVPFGATWHDWAALELGVWIARVTGAPLHLAGAASTGDDGRDASRLLADASLIVQHRCGLVPEPRLASPGRKGVTALAEGAGLLVAGFSERWREEGLGGIRTELVDRPPAPTALVRRGPRPGGLAPGETRTRFTWSLTGDAA
jgi:DNA-binding SARP family transcriptional activator